jgi:uncharacterized Zn finger protein
MARKLETAFAPQALRALAWQRSFERGAGYAADGRVKRLKVEREEVTATVRGTQPYRVRLWIEDGELAYSCTCPVAADGLFCKHCVAVGLVMHEAATGAHPAGRRRAVDHVRTYLEGLDKARLIDLVMSQAGDDELLRGRLEVEAARARGATADLKDYRRIIRQVITPRGFVDYRSMYDYTRAVDDLVDSLSDLLAAGFGTQVIELSEHALACLEDASGNVDDSSGRLSDIKARICGLHHEACVAAQPDPVALAERLFEWELHSDWETFFGAAESYADVLGAAGLAVYRRRAEEAWARTPALEPGQEHDFGRFAITHIMETLARVSGDLDMLIAVEAHDLSSPYRFAEIVTICRDAGRFEEALAWAERGIAVYPDCTDTRLVEVLAEEYERCGRDADALTVMWSFLERRPTVDSYMRLKAHAAKDGDWDEWRGRALERLRNAASEPGPPIGTMPMLGMPGLPAAAQRRTRTLASVRPPVVRWASDRSEVVKALLWEGDADAAWEEAVAGGCSTALWMQVAAARAAHHPADALPVYKREAERLIAQKNKRAYEEAVELLLQIEDLMERLRGGEFSEYLDAVKAKHKQKRSLMTLLDEADWPRRPSPPVAGDSSED